MAPNTKEVDRKTENRDAAPAVDPRQQDQLDRIEQGKATKEGLGGWAALATQRSTAHVVDPTKPRTQGATAMAPLVVDPNDGSEQPVMLEDQLAQNKGIEDETKKILDNQPQEGARDDETASDEADEGDETEGDETGEADESTEDDEADDESEEADEEEEAEPIDAADYTKEQLIDMASERNIKVKSSWNKDEIADAINNGVSTDEDEEQ